MKKMNSLVSLMTLSALFCSSAAFAQLKPSDFDRPGQFQPRPPGQNIEVGNQDPGQLERARQQELQARAQEEQRIRDEQARQDAIREQQRQDEIRRQQDDWRRQQAWREQQQREAVLEAQQAAAAQAQRDAEYARQQAEAAAEAARHQSSVASFSQVTRKAGGEWLRVQLSPAVQLESVTIEINSAAARIHDVMVYFENGQKMSLDQLKETGTIVAGDSGTGYITIAGRVTTIDTRVESMGAKADVSVRVNSVEGAPSLSTKRFSSK